MHFFTSRDTGARSLLRAVAMLGTLAACRGPETFRGLGTDAGAGSAPSGAGGTGGRISVETGTGGDSGGAGGAISNIDAPVMDEPEPMDAPVAETPPNADAPRDIPGETGPDGGNAVAPDPNLVGYWKFDEGMGTTLHDSSSKANDARVTNAIAWAAGAGNLPPLKFTDASAISLGGGYGTAGTSALPANNHTQTISVWANLRSATGSDQYMVCLWNPGALQSVSLGVRANQLSAWAWGPAPLVTTTPPPVNSWHHIAYTYDGTTHRLYLDGQMASSGTGGPNTASVTRAEIGAYSGSNLFNGMLDDLRVYTVALTGNQVARLAAGEPNPGAL